jgi:hypothetical protein
MKIKWYAHAAVMFEGEGVRIIADPYEPELAGLAPIPDPADRAVRSPVNPRASWTVTFTSEQIRSAVMRCGGPDIGSLQGVDLSNQVPLGGHPISVKIFGSFANADLRADDFLRTCLGLRSTMVRLNPF